MDDYVSQRNNVTITTFVFTSDQQTGWKKPPYDFIKCNYDCSFNQNNEASKAAWIYRDANGFYLGAAQSRGLCCKTSLEAELQALLMAMQHVWSCDYQQIIFEGDNMKVRKLLNDGILNFAVHNWVRDIKIWQRKFKEVQICWISRNGNKVVDCLIKEILHVHCNFVFNFYVSICIILFLHDEHSG